MSNRTLKGIECKFSFHIPETEDNDDLMVVKERLHYTDGTTVDNLRTIHNFRRPFYITKEPYRRHKDKKETERLDRTNTHTATESRLNREACMRLGGYYATLRNNHRVVRDSPYVYGLDVSVHAFLKNAYLEKYGELTTPNVVCTFDIETDTITDEIIIIGIALKDKLYTVINKSLLTKRLEKDDANSKALTKKYNEILSKMYDKYIPKTNLSKTATKEYVVVDNELDTIKTAFKKMHEWGPDFMAVWNIDYDVPKVLDVLKRYNEDPRYIFSDPSLPRKHMYFKYKEGQKAKLTDSGKYKPVAPEEQWHNVVAPAKFKWIDAMSAHRYIRAGGKSVPGGYSLDNMLKYELGDKLGKLKFEDDEETKGLAGLKWHVYMVENRPLQYVIYNDWDKLSMHQLEEKNKDLSYVITLLAGISSLDIFNSGPKKIVEAMHFFYLSKGFVMGTKPIKIDSRSPLGLDNWIAILPAYRIKENTLPVLGKTPSLRTNVRMFAAESDQVSGYPSDGMAANVAKDTTVREIRKISGLSKEEFKTQNMNILYGKVNSIEYATTMLKFPTVYEVDEYIKKKKKKNTN